MEEKKKQMDQDYSDRAVSRRGGRRALWTEFANETEQSREEEREN